MLSKRHHAVPRFYLDRFAQEDGLIYLHNIETQTAERVNPKNAIVEKYLYAPEVGVNPKDDTFEKFLAERIEGPAVPCLERLANGEVVSSEDRERIALFIAYQEYRSQHMRDIVTDLMTQVAKDVLDISLQDTEYMKSAFEKMGKPMSDEELAKMSEAWYSGGIEVKGTKAAWLSSAHVPTKIAELLYNLPWTVVEAPDGAEFLTSDTPVVKVLTDPKVPRMYAGGWVSPSAESSFALDPRHLLVIKRGGEEGRFRIRREGVREVNKRVIALARRFVVSRSEDQYVETIATKFMRLRSKANVAELSDDDRELTVR